MPTYERENYRTYKLDDEGVRILLANFTAQITKETRFVDGMTQETSLTIEGETKSNGPEGKVIKLPPVEVASNQFPGMQWVMQAWGVRAVIQPGSGVKEDLRTAIQLASNPEVSTIYKSIGWTTINGEKAYLHQGGAITKNGNDEKVTVRLPQELSKYNLSSKADIATAVKASIALAMLCPHEIGWTLWAATYAPLFGPVDFATHLTGRSGTFKSELISLFQSHYGPEMDARNLPGSWSSTGNALEAQAYFAAFAAFVIDDFVPVGTSWQVRAYQTTADKIIRSQGNQAGRARLTDTSNLQTAFYPRGIILSTGEDTPEGHSVRARMMIMELSPGDIDTTRLTKAQQCRTMFCAATAGLIKYLCAVPIDLKEKSEQIRNKYITCGHTRTPPMMGRLIATAEAVLNWACGQGYITAQQSSKWRKEATEAIITTGQRQQGYLETADPVEIFSAGLRQVLGAGLAHIRTLNGGIPGKPTMLGWTEENSQSDIPNYKSHGPCIGWINWNEDEIYIEINIGYNAVKKVTGSELTLTKQTLFKRMKDAGHLTRVDEARQRNTVRITAENHPRQVISLAASTTLETQEVGEEEVKQDDPEDTPMSEHDMNFETPFN